MKNKKTWLITGAARGLGLEITKVVLAAGDKVIGTVRANPSALIAQINDVNFTAVIIDVTNEEQVIEALTKLTGEGHDIDVLVNNAGFGMLGAVEEASDAEVRKNYETNVFGLLNVTRHVLPVFRKQRSGHIINMSSVGGLRAAAGWGIYSSTKFAVEGLTEALYRELAPLNIFATVVEPGYFRTNFLDASSLNRVEKVIDDYAATAGKMKETATAVNYNQLGDPKKLAGALVKIVHSNNPPLHLPLGQDSLNAYRTKITDFDKDIATWHDTIVNTDHDDVKV